MDKPPTATNEQRLTRLETQFSQMVEKIDDLVGAYREDMVELKTALKDETREINKAIKALVMGKQISWPLIIALASFAVGFLMMFGAAFATLAGLGHLYVKTQVDPLRDALASYPQDTIQAENIQDAGIRMALTAQARDLVLVNQAQNGGPLDFGALPPLDLSILDPLILSFPNGAIQNKPGG